MLQLSTKCCWNSAFDARGSRLIIVVVQLGAVKIYAAAVEALRKKEREDETQFTAKINGFSQFHPLLNANVGFFCRCFHPVYDKTQGSLVLCFFLLYR
jgi:hypothetical protein